MLEELGNADADADAETVTISGDTFEARGIPIILVSHTPYQFSRRTARRLLPVIRLLWRLNARHPLKHPPYQASHPVSAFALSAPESQWHHPRPQSTL